MRSRNLAPLASLPCEMRFWEPAHDYRRILMRTLLITRRHEGRHALPDSTRSLVEPPLLVR